MKRTPERQKERVSFRDLCQLIIKLILVLLVIAWFVKEYIQNKELDPFTLIILLIILAFIIWLILRQRHVVLLRCSLTAPSGCIRGDPNILPGRILEPVVGGAYGLGFSHDLVEVRDPSGDLLSGVVVYPNGIGNPDTTLTQGNFPVVSGTLCWIDVEKCAADAGIDLLTSTTFEVTLRVFGVDGSELSPPCTITFNLSVSEVYIKRISTPWSVNFTDPDEPLRHAEDPASALATIGGSMHVRGAANIYGCAGENIREYTIWAIPDSTFSFAQPAALTPVAPGPDWVQVAHVEFNAQTIDGTTYTADQVRAYNILDGDPEPNILTNVWGTRNECICIHVDFHLSCFCWKIPDLKPNALNSNLLPKLKPIHESGTGKFTFLLQVIDTSGNQYYDIQRAWIDNEIVKAVITGIAGLAPCADLYTRTNAGAFKTVNIEGTAWDQLIDPANLTKPTSDNFDKYVVDFQKQGAAGRVRLFHDLSASLVTPATAPTSTDPVPARPNPIGVGTLVSWNLQTVDAASNPMGLPAAQLLAPGEECTYNIILEVWDKTVVNEWTVHWSGWVVFPIKIINSPEP